MTNQPRSRRALRDLALATMATGAAGLVVSLVVGGTTEGIRAAFPPDGREVPTYAAGLPGRGTSGTAAGGGVTVRVRPSLPAPLAIASVFDLVPSAVGSSAAADGVRGLLLERAADAVTGAVAVAVAAPEPVTPTTPPTTPPAPAAPTLATPVVDGIVAASDTPTKRRGPTRATKSSSSPSKAGANTGGDADPSVSAASSDRAAPGSAPPEAGNSAAAPAAEDERDGEHGRSQEAPPAQAPAYGYRNR